MLHSRNNKIRHSFFHETIIWSRISQQLFFVRQYLFSSYINDEYINVLSNSPSVSGADPEIIEPGGATV